MTVLVIAQLRFKDVERYRIYQTAFPAVFAKSNGRVICADESPLTLHGEWAPDKIVVMEFPTEQDARDFLEGSDYQSISADRDAGAETISLLVRAF